jgi:hypothetical protein
MVVFFGSGTPQQGNNWLVRAEFSGRHAAFHDLFVYMCALVSSSEHWPTQEGSSWLVRAAGEGGNVLHARGTGVCVLLLVLLSYCFTVSRLHHLPYTLHAASVRLHAFVLRVVSLSGLTLPSVRLSCTTPNKHSKVAAVAQRGGLLFTHKVRRRCLVAVCLFFCAVLWQLRWSVAQRGGLLFTHKVCTRSTA